MDVGLNVLELMNNAASTFDHHDALFGERSAVTFNKRDAEIFFEA
jgi:hypothetical protein